MILKKPYAFLIKHFKVIHLIITVLLCIFAFKSIDIFNFFNDYVMNNYKTAVTLGLAHTYIPSYLYLILFGVITLLVVILVLFIHKKKKNTLYILMIIYYLILFFGLFYLSSVLASFETELLGSTVARGIRDVLLIILIPQVVFIIYMGLRSVGFNIKQFNFADDLREIEYADSDSEEVEISINFEGYKAKRSIRRMLREFYYYFRENKLIVLCIVIITSVILIIYGFSHSEANYDANFKSGVPFTYQNVQVTVKGSMVSNLDYNGNIIKEGSYFLAVKVNIDNNSGKSVSLDYNNFKLQLGKITINPTVNLAPKFIDFGPVSVPTMFSPKVNKDIILVYEINPSQIKKAMKLLIYNGSVYTNGEYISKNIYVKINPTIVGDPQLIGNFSVGEKINLSDSLLKDSSFKALSLEINKSKMYKYESCYKGDCNEYDDMITVPLTSDRSNNIILSVDTEFSQDEEAEFSKSYNSLRDFAEYFITIRYQIDGKVKTSNINVTPKQDVSFVAFEVPNEIFDANIIQLVITIRNKEYIINLKG